MKIFNLQFYFTLDRVSVPLTHFLLIGLISPYNLIHEKCSVHGGLNGQFVTGGVHFDAVGDVIAGVVRHVDSDSRTSSFRCSLGDSTMTKLPKSGTRMQALTFQYNAKKSL